jgi:hypothetical protein
MDSKSPGGVDMLVSYDNDDDDNDDEDDDDDEDGVVEADHPKIISLVVRRCCFDSDTILKESSERAILRRLHEAIRIWQKVRAMKV